MSRSGLFRDAGYCVITVLIEVPKLHFPLPDVAFPPAEGKRFAGVFAARSVDSSVTGCARPV